MVKEPKCTMKNYRAISSGFQGESTVAINLPGYNMALAGTPLTSCRDKLRPA
jgi:hypothetical protein